MHKKDQAYQKAKNILSAKYNICHWIDTYECQQHSDLNIKILDKNDITPFEPILSRNRVMPIMLMNNGHLILGVYSKNDSKQNIIAMCAIGFDDYGLAMFGSLWVDKEHRKQGIATLLVRLRLELALYCNCNKIIVTPLHTSISIYRKLNFEVEGESKFNDSESIYQCSLDLNEFRLNRIMCKLEIHERDYLIEKITRLQSQADFLEMQLSTIKNLNHIPK